MYNTNILQFIKEFQSTDEQTIKYIFKNKYCYYFAVILQTAFPGGTIVWCSPYDHIAYQYDGQIYDIDGICNYHAENYIPVSYLQDTLLDFLHIPGKPSYTTDQQIANIILKYKEENS